MRSLLALILLAIPTVVLAEEKTPRLYDFEMKAIDGKEMKLADYKGKVLLFVNVASKCGYTKQYKELQAIYEKYGKDGFVVIGIPANEFLAQEPGTNEEIVKFCKDNYKVTFPMAEKVVVKGKGITPLYDYLTSSKTNPKHGGEIKWNFTKFVVSRNGDIVGRFEPKVKPDAKEVVELIEAELKKK